MLTTTIGERDAQRPASRSMPGWRGTRTRCRRVAATWDRASTPCSAPCTRTTSRESFTCATRPSRCVWPRSDWPRTSTRSSAPPTRCSPTRAQLELNCVVLVVVDAWCRWRRAAWRRCWARSCHSWARVARATRRRFRFEMTGSAWACTRRFHFGGLYIDRFGGDELPNGYCCYGHCSEATTTQQQKTY